MSYAPPRWLRIASLLLVGAIVGLLAGAEFGYRLAIHLHNSYSQELERSYIDSRVLSLYDSRVTMAQAEEGKIARIISNHSTIMRIRFIDLVDLHKLGHFKEREPRIVEELTKARKFMAERPSTFIDQKFFALDSLVEQFKNPSKEDPASDRATRSEKEQLQAAFDYVDRLPSVKKDR